MGDQQRGALEIAETDRWAISGPLRGVNRGQSRSSADGFSPRSRPLALVIAPICKQEVRGSNPVGFTHSKAQARRYFPDLGRDHCSSFSRFRVRCVPDPFLSCPRARPSSCLATWCRRSSVACW